MPGWCRQRVVVNGEEGDTKSRAGRRAVGLPPQLVVLLREHEKQQDRDREHARQLWRESGYVFTSATGEPLIPNSDYHRWKALLKKAGVRDARLQMPGTLLRLCSWFLECRSGPSWGSWGGRARRWRRATSRSRTRSGRRCGSGWRAVAGRAGGWSGCQLRPGTETGGYQQPMPAIGPGGACPVSLAEDAGFEPARA
jgi:hypothetical protein